ncbi:MAG: hypothetical protein MUO85_01810 [candidate division Zixibacteria bacterium]|nr:hypothetical protein [candidate division Zixibacteria bacterium]
MKKVKTQKISSKGGQQNRRKDYPQGQVEYTFDYPGDNQISKIKNKDKKGYLTQ